MRRSSARACSLRLKRRSWKAIPPSGQRILSFVIVGGGPTGVELAGAIKELAVDVIPRDFRVADTRRARVILIEAGPRLLAALEPSSSERALKQLEALNVEVWLGKPVTDISAAGVTVDGQLLRSYNVIWAAGVRPSPLVQSLGAELGPGGRVKVQPDCSIPGHPNVFVIGDAAYLVDSKTGKQVPGVSQGALQMGKYVAAIVREEQAVATRAIVPTPRQSASRARGFHYRDLGSMATVGKSRAVVEIGPFKFGGSAGLVCLAGAAHHGAHRIPQSDLGAGVVDLRIRFFSAGIEVDYQVVRQERRTLCQWRRGRPPRVKQPGGRRRMWRLQPLPPR